MKHIIQAVIAIFLFGFIIVSTAISANAAPQPPGPASVLWDSELPPDIFDDGCEGGSACPGNIFSDMRPVGHWAHLAIDWAITHHITMGTGSGRFNPTGECTRAEAVTLLWRAAGSPPPQSSDCPFLDVPEDAYYREAVIWAGEQTITQGTSATAFSPHVVCSRGQIVTLLWRACGASVESDGTHPYRDVSSSAFYRDAVIWAVRQGITQGTSSNTFSPDLACTREQIVTFLYRTCRS